MELTVPWKEATISKPVSKPRHMQMQVKYCAEKF